MTYRKIIHPLIGIFLGICVAHFAPSNTVVYAEDPPEVPATQICIDEIERLVAKEMRQFRAVVYGMPKADKAAPGSLRYDVDGMPWIKVDESTWKSPTDEIDNGEMDDTAEFPDRQGILQTHRALTSELLPFVMESLYSLDCNLQKTCTFIDASFDQAGTDPVELTVHPIGCKTYKEETVLPCHLAHEQAYIQPFQGTLVGYCRELTEEALIRERLMMKTALEYDASYRSMLQFAGEFDLFISNLRTPLANSIRNSAGIIGWLNRIPCFTASCADYPLDP